MISVSTAQHLIRYVFLDSSASPFTGANNTFTLSLHTERAYMTTYNELSSPSYHRITYPRGGGHWELGARSAVNSREIRWPAADVGDAWEQVRSVGLWLDDGVTLVWSMALDGGAAIVSGGDSLVIPPGGLVVGFG